MREHRKEFWSKILTPYLFSATSTYTSFGHTVKIFSKLENKSQNLAYCSLLQPIVVYNSSEIESTFPLFFLKLRDRRLMVSICFIRKDKYDWFPHEGLLLDWLILLLYLLQSVCCSKYSAKTASFSVLNVPLHLLHQFVWKHFRIFVTVMNLNVTSKVFHKGNLEENFINFVMWHFTCMLYCPGD